MHSTEFKMVCPFCGHNNDAATMIDGSAEKPDEGSYAFCFTCAHLSIVDSSKPGNMRMPTHMEIYHVLRDVPRLRAVFEHWEQAKGPPQ